jgi:hypothetical protein
LTESPSEYGTEDCEGKLGNPTGMKAYDKSRRVTN